MIAKVSIEIDSQYVKRILAIIKAIQVAAKRHGMPCVDIEISGKGKMS